MGFWDGFDPTKNNLVQHAGSRHNWARSSGIPGVPKRLLPSHDVPIAFARALSAHGVQTGLWGNQTFKGGIGEVPACCAELWRGYEEDIISLRFDTLVNLAVDVYKTELEIWNFGEGT